MKIAIYGRSFSKSFNEPIIRLFKVLNNYNVHITIFKPFFEFIINNIHFKPKVQSFFNDHKDICKEVDLIFSLGGDGTFLETISFVRDYNIPIVGINTGRLGFLSYISREDIADALDAIFNKKYSLEHRVLIKLVSSVDLFEGFNYALNEVTIQKKDSTMITIHAYLNNEYLNSYWADGLIISTPTGSTAYSLSVGGPIVIPNSSNFIISPIAPHNLTVRPIVVPDSNEIVLKVNSRNSKYLASLDYRSEILDTSVELTLKRADFTIKILKLENHSFYSTIRNKLMWGADKRN